MSTKKVDSIMKYSKFTVLLAVGATSSYFAYYFYRRIQIMKPLQFKVDYDFENAWKDLVYDENNITLQSIKEVFDQTLKVGFRGFITISNYMEKQRRFFGWGSSDFCVRNVIEEFGRKIKFSREVIQQLLNFKGYNYQTFANLVFSRANLDQSIVQLRKLFESSFFQQFNECSKQMNGDEILYYISKFTDIVDKKKEEIQKIKNCIISNNFNGLKAIIFLSYLRDIWYLQFGFEYQVCFTSMQNYEQNHPQAANLSLVIQEADIFNKKLEKLFFE